MTMAPSSQRFCADAHRLTRPLTAFRTLRTALFLLSVSFVLQTAAAHSIFYRTVPFHDTRVHNHNQLQHRHKAIEDSDTGHKLEADYRSIGDVVDETEEKETDAEKPTVTDANFDEDENALEGKWDVIVPGGVATLFDEADTPSPLLNKAPLRRLGSNRSVRRLVILQQEPTELQQVGLSEKNGDDGKSHVKSSPLNRPAGGVGSLSPRLHSHLMALRPDYAFRNIANIFRNIFDTKIERNRKNTIQGKKDD